ncbi:DegT/DnrJ/EryC1/StrS family aminotransferase [Phenylobacterium sp.]|uniref:DegT/DnrJ/EryC1/StrS family aminotransferase n=1 Tax=Phenylobacterium sp. TaxID=1871053 RepID=UPI0039834135
MKFFDLGLDEPSLRRALDAAYHRVMDSGRMVLGPEVEAFEAAFAGYCGASHGVGVGNGLDALVLALRAAAVGPGDEVIVPSHTFAATWMAVTAVGATPVPAEVDAATFTLDPAAAEAAVTPRTAAIIPVSLYGHPAEMTAIMALAERHGLFVLEDAAQSHGAACRGRRTGSLAHATAFSFYPTKNLGALGDAGALVTDDAELAAKVRRLRNYGSEQKYVHEEQGANSRLDELQAAFLGVRLQGLELANGRRRAVAGVYAERLAGLESVVTPTQAEWAHHVYHLYAIRSPARDALQSHLRSRGVETLIHYPVPCHRQPAFADLGFAVGAFPLAEALAAQVLSLPMWPGMPVADVEAVADAVTLFETGPT